MTYLGGLGEIVTLIKDVNISPNIIPGYNGPVSGVSTARRTIKAGQSFPLIERLTSAMIVGQPSYWRIDTGYSTYADVDSSNFAKLPTNITGNLPIGAQSTRFVVKPSFALIGSGAAMAAGTFGGAVGWVNLFRKKYAGHRVVHSLPYIIAGSIVSGLGYMFYMKEIEFQKNVQGFKNMGL